MRMLVDFHHSSLLRSLNLLFQERLGIEVFRPIGMEWFDKGYWAINKQADTAKQYLDLDQAYKPSDGTPPLNLLVAGNDSGSYVVIDPGEQSAHAACTFDFFINNKFDYVVASIPQHVEIFEALIEQYQPWCKLIVQMGNNWNLQNYKGKNILASIAPQSVDNENVMFYHQEFDTGIFFASECLPTKEIYSFVNVIENTGMGWEDYKNLQEILTSPYYEMKAFGGQCPDGSTVGPVETANKMREAQFIFHVKPGGDGFGHVIHNAYAIGRPLITRPSHYRGQLAEQLLVPGTFVDLDRYGPEEVKNIIIHLTDNPDELRQMGERAANRFREVVNYDIEADKISLWLQSL